MRTLRLTLRRLAASPLFTIGATLTLAIAIGATASVFSVVDGVLLKAFPYRDPDRVLTVWETNQSMHLERAPVGPEDYLDFRAQAHAFTTLAAASYRQYTVTGKGEPERVTGFAITPSYFSALGISPVIGRPLAPDSSGSAEAVIGYGLWQRRFGGDRSVLGQAVTVDGHPYTIVGVMPAGLPAPDEMWTRLSFTADDASNRGEKTIFVYGRLSDGVTPERARRELETIAGRLAQAYPVTNGGWGTRVDPIVQFYVGDVQTALLMLLAAAACVLLIGAANLANLFLVRCLGREREIALRTALGATRGRVVRELLVEAATLGLGGGALGVGIAIAGVSGLRALAPPTLPRLSEVQVDGRVVAFCALISIATVLLFGMAPALHAARGKLTDVLKQGGRGTSSARQHGLQDSLVVLQMVIALVLLTGAGLLIESFDHFRRMDPGFRPESVLTAQLALSPDRYATPEKQAAFATSLEELLGRATGIQSASISDAVPANNANEWGFNIVPDPVPDPEHIPLAWAVAVSPNYFHTMGIALRRGRSIRPTDDLRAVKVAVVDELLVRRFFGGRDPIGQRVTFIGGADTMTVVGVAASVKEGGLAGEDRPAVYMSVAQFPNPVLYVAARASGNPEDATRAVRNAIATLDPTIPMSDVQTMSERMAQSVSTTRFSSFLASLFAVVALILAAIGIYSVLASVVGQRRREIGVRLALGASRTQVMGEVLRRALMLTSIGIAIGSATAWLVTRALAGLFLSVSPHDPVVLVGAALFFTLVALAAASVPAFRTTTVNPTEALNAT